MAITSFPYFLARLGNNKKNQMIIVNFFKDESLKKKKFQILFLPINRIYIYTVFHHA